MVVISDVTMANNSGAIGLLVFSFFALVATVLLLWWLEWSRPPPPSKSRQPNTRITRLQPARVTRKIVTLINPTSHTGKLIINGQESVLRVGRNDITIPTNDMVTDFSWQLSDGPIRVAPSTPTKGGEVYVLLNDGLFRKGEWSKSTPIQVISLPYSANDVVNAFQSAYTITPATSSKSSVSISQEEIKNAYIGLPLHIKFTTSHSLREREALSDRERLESTGTPSGQEETDKITSITTTITNPRNPLIIFQSLRWLGDAGGVIELHATQDPVTITSTNNSSVYIQVAEQPGHAGKVYEIYPGTNYIDGGNPKNRWVRLMSHSGQDTSQWMPIDNYRTNGKELF